MLNFYFNSAHCSAIHWTKISMSLRLLNLYIACENSEDFSETMHLHATFLRDASGNNHVGWCPFSQIDRCHQPKSVMARFRPLRKSRRSVDMSLREVYGENLSKLCQFLLVLVKILSEN